MKNSLIITILILSGANVFAQTFTYFSEDTVRIYQPAAVETFYVPIVNISAQPITIFTLRKNVNVPPGWVTSICFDGTCFADYIDSVANTSDFGFSALAPGDTILLGLHFFTDSSGLSGKATMVVANLNNPAERKSLTFHLSNAPTKLNDEKLLAEDFHLYQNFPNPFNPSTKIKFSIPTSPPAHLLEERGGSQMRFVSLKIYDMLGDEVATLVNEEKEPGIYEVEFYSVESLRTSTSLSNRAMSLPSGVYFYRLNVGNFSATKKMIIAK